MFTLVSSFSTGLIFNLKVEYDRYKDFSSETFFLDSHLRDYFVKKLNESSKIEPNHYIVE